MNVILTEAGCRARREALWKKLPQEIGWTLISDAAHLMYFAGFHASPFAFNSQGGTAALILGRTGDAILITDNIQQPFAERASVTETVLPLWYRCIDAPGDRAVVVAQSVVERLSQARDAKIGYESARCPAAIVDGLRRARPGVNLVDVSETIVNLRRNKLPDEVDLIRRALAAATAGLHAAMEQLRPGMTEFDAYRLVQRAAGEAAHGHALVYGDFVSGERCEAIVGAPSERVIRPGDLVLLDFSVVLDGYRGDFCNAFVCGGKPTRRQQELFSACRAALQAGEQTLRAGAACQQVYGAVRDALKERGLADYFPHHAGHGIGLAHPEAPYFVPESPEMLQAGDVVTLEPGVYLPGVGGMRFERDYLVTDAGFELLSHHRVGLEL
ncbi:MAG: M24 family metallopeptidase [Planctomycetaceae bacterium]